MSVFQRIASGFRLAAYLGRNPLTMLGAALTTSSALTLIGFWLFDIASGGTVHPYVGVIFFLILPGIFLIGLLMIPAGLCGGGSACRAAGSFPRNIRRWIFRCRQSAKWWAGLRGLPLRTC